MEYVKPFIIGGSVIAGSKIASKIMGPELAPIVGGLPTGIIASFFLSNNKVKREYFEGYVYTSFILFLAILFIHIATKYFPSASVNVISGSAFIVWAVLSYFIIKLHKDGVL